MCGGCCEVIQPRKSFKACVPTRSTWKLEGLHSDVCGPLEAKSLGGNLYFVSFIDDYTRMMWLYLVKKKSEVFSVLKEIKKLIENQSGKTIKFLRTDGDGEYTSLEFRKFCKEEGIVHEVIAPYTPQHNGIVERRNRTILNLVRSMRKEKNMPQYFWDITTAACILNRILTKRLQDSTPYEKWMRKKSDVSHFKVFGSLCYKHVPEQGRKKVDSRAQSMILIGYLTTEACRLFDPEKRKINIR